MSERAQKILTWIREQNGEELFIRQASLAELFGCSRRSIGRALKELKDAGLLVDLNQRHKNRCKMYEIKIPLLPTPRLRQASNLPLKKGEDKTGLTPQAQRQWDFYGKTFALVFRMPNLEEYYAQVTWQLTGVKEESELYSQTFAGLFKACTNF